MIILSTFLFGGTMPYDTQGQYYTGTTDKAVDEGLRKYMLGVYNYMLIALCITAIVSVVVLNTTFLLKLVFSPAIYILLLAELGIVFYMSARIQQISASTAQTLFWVYAALNGFVIGGLLFAYTGESVARAFFATASIFGFMSIYGYTTKKSLDSWGSLLFAGLIGIIVASLINIFLGWSMLSFIISVVAVIIFTGLIAYDTQKIKQMYYAGDHQEVASKKSIFGALSLYIDFIALFIHLLRLIGQTRD